MGVFILFSFWVGLSFAEEINQATRIQLENKRRDIRSWVQECDNGVMAIGRNCDADDLVLFSGMLCLSGERGRCEDAARSQDGDGRWWRNPDRIGNERKASFSNDQAQGTFAYLAATGDRDAATAWLKWIKSNSTKVCREGNGLSCYVLLPLWGLFGRVWEYIGLEPDTRMKSVFKSGMDEQTLFLESALQKEVGHQHHLSAVHIMNRLFLGRHSFLVRQSARALAKDQPTNPFFQFLHRGPEQDIAELVLTQCPSFPLKDHPGGWVWMDNPPLVKPLDDSMGWDCIFMLNLLLNPEIHQKMGFISP